MFINVCVLFDCLVLHRYMGRDQLRPRALGQKFKGMVIESVGWDKTNQDQATTGNILIGTDKVLNSHIVAANALSLITLECITFIALHSQLQ